MQSMNTILGGRNGVKTARFSARTGSIRVCSVKGMNNKGEEILMANGKRYWKGSKVAEEYGINLRRACRWSTNMQ